MGEREGESNVRLGSALSEIPYNGRRRESALVWMGAAAIAVSLFSHLGAIGFLGPDEPRYAWIARAMAVTATGSLRDCTASRGLKSPFSTTGPPP